MKNSIGHTDTGKKAGSQECDRQKVEYIKPGFRHMPGPKNTGKTGKYSSGKS